MLHLSSIQGVCQVGNINCRPKCSQRKRKREKVRKIKMKLSAAGLSAHKPQFYWNYSAAAAPGARPTPSRVAMASTLSKPFFLLHTFPDNIFPSHFPSFLPTASFHLNFFFFQCSSLSESSWMSLGASKQQICN